MTVSEMIEKLKEFPPDMCVIMCGYEGGYSDINEFNYTPIMLNKNTAWYYGKHDSPHGDEVADETALEIN